MPNLVGIWQPGLDRDSIQRTLTKQLQRVRVPGVPYTDRVATYPGVGMALQDSGLLENGPQPVFSRDLQAGLLLDGEISNVGEIHKRFAQDLGRETLSPSEVCLRVILSQGTEAAARLFSGFFCIVFYEQAEKRLTIISDRYGARSVFYVQRGDAVLFATEIKALSVVDPGRRKISEIGALEFFCYGTHFMDRTWMEGYLRVPPASILTMDATGLRIHKYWTYRYDEGARKLDQATYASVFGVLLDRAVERCMAGSGRIGIFLSGGYDSRSVAAGIRKHHRPIPAFTFGLPQSRDVRYGKMLAERLGLEHHVPTLEGSYLYPNCRKIVWRTEGMLPFSDTTSIHWHSLLKKKMDIILTGFLGEFSGSHTWPQLLLSRSRRQAVRAIFNRFVAPGLAAAEPLFQPNFFARVSPVLRGMFEQSFEIVDNEHPLNVADSWNFLNLQPRLFHAAAVDRHKFELRAPHTDRDLVEFLLTIPPYARLEQRVYKKMIASSFPEIQSVPCTNSGRAIQPSFVREYPLMAGRYVARRVLKPLRGLVGQRPALGRESGDANEEFRAESDLAERMLSPLLASGVFPASVFRESEIERLIREHYEGKASHERVLSLLISWGLAAKYFLHDDVTDVPPDMWPS